MEKECDYCHNVETSDCCKSQESLRRLEHNVFGPEIAELLNQDISSEEFTEKLGKIIVPKDIVKIEV